MIEPSLGKVLLRPADVKPSQRDVEVIGVFNPAVAMIGDTTVMLARVAERPIARRRGWTALPRWNVSVDAPSTIAVDWFGDQELSPVDARVVRIDKTRGLRLTSISHLQIFRSVDAKLWETVSLVLPESILPETIWEEFGIEDPRITKIDDVFWITYVAVSRWGAATALMSSVDLITFKRHGIIFASENKDVVLFPEQIAGKYVALHRPNPNSHFSPPQIWLARSPDLLHWGSHEMMVGGSSHWEGDRVGAGTPPILCDEGFLTLYHGSATSETVGTVGQYCAGALLLDRDQPSRVLARSRDPIMRPMADFETCGFVPNVIFPTALLDRGDDLQVFYGAADTCVAVTQFSKRSVLDSLISYSPTHLSP